MKSCKICSFVSGFFQNLACFQGSSMMLHVSVIHFFLWLNNISLYEHSTICLSIHHWMDIWIVCIFGYYEHTIILCTFLHNVLCLHVFNSLAYIIFRSGISGSYGIFNFLSNCQSYSKLPAPFYILISDVPTYPHPYQHLLLFIFIQYYIF